MPYPESPADYAGGTGNVVAFLNGSSSNYNQQLRSTALELLCYFEDKFKVIRPENTYELTKEKIANTIKLGDIIVSGGGDGTYSFLINTLLTYGGLSKDVRHTPVISTYGGNANMIAHELTPSDSTERPSLIDVFNHGRVVDIFPLKTTITDGDKIEKEISRFAIAFFGLGMTGLGALELEYVRGDPRRESQNTRKYIDYLAGFRGVKAGRKVPFSLTSKIIDGGSNSEQSTKYDQVYEASVINGSRMARFGRFPSKLTQREFFEMIIDNKAWLSIFINAARMRLGRIPGLMFADGDPTLVLDYHALDQSRQLRGQIDGEPLILPVNGTIEVRRYSKYFRGVAYKNENE